MIHPTAILDSTAKMGKNVKIGPYSIVGENVKIGDNSSVGNSVTISKNTKIGESCKIFHYSSIGEIPQDLKFGGEETKTVIGDRTIIRENATINSGTKALGQTKIGSDCLLMASTHVAHDCVLGDHVILSNLSTLGGHVEIGDWTVLGGGVLVHQFTKLGKHVFIGGGFRVVQDVPPFILAAETPLKFQGINNVGLKRRGFHQTERSLIKKIYRLYFDPKINRKSALKTIKKDFTRTKIRDSIIQFIETSKRGII